MIQSFLAEDNDGTYGMHIIYDGSENELQIGGKNNTNVYGPHLRISRNDPNVSIGGPIDQAYALRVYGNLEPMVLMNFLMSVGKKMW